jgi:hypothetical protein
VLAGAAGALLGVDDGVDVDDEELSVDVLAGDDDELSAVVEAAVELDFDDEPRLSVL